MLEEERIYYVYKLINPIDNQVFYIGYGKNRRIGSHWRSFCKSGWYGCDGNYDKYCVFRKIQEAGLEPIEEIITNKNLSKKNAIKVETKFIKKYGRIWDGSGILTNIKEDESKSPMEIPSIRDKVSKALKGRNVICEYFLKTGRTFEDYRKFVEDQNEIQRERFSGEKNPNYGIHWSDKQKKHMSKNKTGLRMVNNGKRQKMVTSEMFPKYIKCGWGRGLIK